MAKPPLNKPLPVQRDGYDLDPPTPDPSAPWASIDDHLQVSETKVIIEVTIVGMSTAAITFARRKMSAMRRVGMPQVPPKDFKDKLVSSVSLLFTTISLYKMLIAYLAASPIGTTDPVLAGAGISVLALMT